ncbi:MAG: ExeM/NucH family extracellular endonuclease [Gammaproteobacteria bacterium]|nr:ExeM/NucH family extracellular endonuclease [Gammaproteobacteria bacterium]NNF50630.1 ExeM/NucH family extracellular endonuclease [Woeseiaceae bacterium]MBT8094021.1 ExeM/NucH family extracellular endonuclease [Gammaproteobacteria bacterium]MBT8105680.1 ExeM/NucH family extracellular endonuclease [Gammaproteobacteria bacterium]NNK25694.1 ExeM/NucH family extracellular endonuclease [Woeseiaceae bacterium]
MRILILIIAASAAAACGGSGGGGGGGNGGSSNPPPPSSGPQSIGALQGTGNASPFDGQSVSIAGVVTGDFQNNDADDRRNLRGFYVQDSADGNAATSDGVFVFDGTSPAVDVDVGDRVEVSGTVAEYFGETQINANTVTVTGTGSIAATPVELPATGTITNSDGDPLANLERYEGMLVEFPDTLSVTRLRNLERFGEVTLSEGGRLYQFTNDNAPGVDAYDAYRDLVARRSIVLDDGLTEQNPDDVHYLNAGTAAGYSIRLGDTLAGLTGNLRFSRGSGGDGDEAWRVMPTTDPSFVSVNPRPGAPALGGSLRVGAFNVLNFFTTIDTGASICGPDGNDGCRGADSSTEYDRQLAKTVTALVDSGADILGLTELENNASDSLSALVNAMNARSGSADFAYIDTGTIHDDVIKAGIIYRVTRVSPVGAYALLDRSVDSRFNDDRNRPALAQAFEVDATGARLSVVVNHLKSKGSDCNADGDPNIGDGQGNCNLTRVNAASALVDWVATDPTGSGDDDYLIIGDMNAYNREDPIEVFRSGGLTNLLDGTPNPYSFVFEGMSGAYDYAIATPGLATQVTGAIEWHINTDEPPIYDYNLEFGRDAGLFDDSTPYRASDHDPAIVGLDLTN